jgi:hypothetical protein
MDYSFKQDEWGTVFNSQETYEAIAQSLQDHGSVIIAWTDLKGTQLDILFTLRPLQCGPVQGGIRGPSDLFVSIMRIGAFAFSLGEADTDEGYYKGKLGEGGKELADLINGVRGCW